MITLISRALKAIRKNEDGATAIEYGLIAALISVVIIAAITLVGADLENAFNQVGNSL